MRNLSKGEGMKETEGKKGYGERDTKLGVGSLVEVRLVGKGLSGSWHAAVVVKARPGRRVVEYEELLSDEREGQKLKESIKVGKGVDGVRSSCRKPRQGSPSKDHRIFLRPRPPRISCPSRSSWTRGLCVDVYWKDAWWEGILLQNVRPDKSSVRVFFPDEGGVEECALRDVRIRQEWDEETGSWSLKGHRTTLISSFKHRTSKREDFLEQELSATVKKLEFLSTEETCREAAFLNDEQDSIPDDDLLESIVKGSRKKLCISKGAGKEFSVIAPKCECQGNDTVVSGGLHRSVQTRYCSKQVSTRRKTRQGEEARSLPPFYDTTVRKKVFKTVDSKNVGGFCQGQECKLSMKPQEAYDDYVDSADHGVGGRRQFLNQNTMDIKGSNASMNHMYRSHQEGSHIERSRYMLVKEEACDDESMDMAVDEKRHSVLHMNGFATSAFPQGCNTPVEAVFSMTPNFLKRQAAGESDFLEPNGDNFGDKFQHFGDKFQHFGKSDKACKKRVSGSHLSGEIERKIERKSKKSRNSVSEDSAGFTGMSYLPKEPFKSKRGWTQYKSPSNQEKLGKKNGTRGGFRMEVLLSAPSGHGLSEDGTGATGGFNARKNILSWLIEAGALVRDQKLFYLHKGKKNLGHGWVTTAGVLCGCCNDIFTLSYFEEHCGSRLHRPCQNIFVDGGKSLTDLQMEVFQKENEFTGSDVHSRMGSGKRRRPEKEKGKVEGDGNDDTCGVCGDGGTLICCDHCPSTFHLTCMEMQEVPKDEWFCPNCRCAICDGSQFNGDQNLFNELTVLFCDQCEREFHVKCLYKRGFPKMDECPQGSWFCGQSCTQIYQSLRGFVGVTNNLSSGFSWTLLRSQAEDSDLKSEGDIELMAEHNIKLSMALSVMQECFKPMIDPRTNIDLVSHVLYNRGSDVSRLNYRGFYTMILEKEDELVSVATIRVHGNVLAEMPLIGTRYQYRRQGMCRRLMYAIEQMLHKIGVKSLVLPAVPELMDTWSGAFGFLPLNSHEKRELTKLNLMAFPGTSLLHKFLPTWPSNSSFRGLLHHVGGTVQVQNISVPQMVNVPIGGPEPFLSGQDMNMSPRAGSLQSYLVKMRDGGSGMFGSDSPASSTSPREVITRRELIHIQHSGAQFDRCRENGYTSKQKSVEKSDRTKVVVGTTRSKRLVKTTQWVADAMNKLAGRPPSQADGVGTKVSMDRSLTLGTSNSPSAVRCMDDQNADEPRKLILRINLSKLKEEKKEKKKKKKDKCQRESSNGEILEAEASHAELDVKPVQSIDFTASRSTNGGAPTFTQDQLQLMSAGGPECTAFVPRVDFRDLEHSPAICGSLTRLVDPDAEFVDIMPALDIGGHLLPLLKHRTRLLRSLPPR